MNNLQLELYRLSQDLVETKRELKVEGIWELMSSRWGVPIIFDNTDQKKEKSNYISLLVS